MNSTIRTIGACMLAIGICEVALAQETTKVPKVAIMWTFAENEKGTSEAGMKTADDLIRKLPEKIRFLGLLITPRFQGNRRV